jgi:hypothetical protein
VSACAQGTPTCVCSQPKEIGLPFTAYYAIDEIREVRPQTSCPGHADMGPRMCLLGGACVHAQTGVKIWSWPTTLIQDGTEKAQKVFISVPTEVGQTEAEEIGGWVTAVCSLACQHSHG